MGPVPSRPRIPEDYGVPTNTEGLLSWSYVAGRLTESKHYWLSTVTPDGLPHTRPIDGFWLDDKLYFGGGSDVRWRRNLDRNPNVCLNLEDGEQAVILHGTVKIARTDRELAERLAKIANEKYEFGQGQTADDYDNQEILVFQPSVAFAWKVFFKDATRWRFPPKS